MSRNFDETLPDEVQKQRSRFTPVEAPAPARPVWNWEDLNAKFRPRLVAAGVIRFGLSQDECESAAQTVLLKALAMNPRVRDPKAYLRAAFLNQCHALLDRRGGVAERESAIASRPLALADSGEIAVRVETVPASPRTAPMCAFRRTLWDRIRAGLRLRP
ncbi:MAG TPA: hypothetical protein VHP60_01360 [Thermoanaerobaculia bacterium]|jgi:hypothetical protein|nr:hypothetical protein [Thermoanaerobaculia bacterium]